MRAPRRPGRTRLAAAALALALGTLAGCELGDIEAAFDFALFQDSADPEVQKVVESQRQARALREAEAARRAFLATGDPAQLGEARRLNPNDAELVAFSYALAEPKTPAYEQAQNELLRLAGEQLREAQAKTTPSRPAVVSKSAIAKKASFTLIEALARMIAAGAPTGGGGPPKALLCQRYVGSLRTAETFYGDDPVREHRLVFGDLCN